MKNPVILIPARYASTRLPGKPLADICGKPMIIHVVERAIRADCGDVWVATDNQQVLDAVKSQGYNAVMTKTSHPSGSDRIWEALQQIDPDAKYDAIINLQGDLPTIEPKSVRDVLAPLAQSKVDIATLATLIDNDSDRQNPSVVKPVVAWNDSQTQGKALYFTRCPAPYGDGDLFHHIGIYAYRRSVLKKFVSLPPSPLEQQESLEQLRALEHNMHIEVVQVETIPLGVDTQEQLEEAREFLK